MALITSMLRIHTTIQKFVVWKLFFFNFFKKSLIPTLSHSYVFYEVANL